ncbi:MAG: WYL domain-containing protein [Synergistaceae bacterium]|nr:WYL domain-containing protein [Synergistaceae bacterium]
MPKDMTSVRHDRLSKVMAFLQSRVAVSHDALFSVGEYHSERTLQNDLSYLRGTYGADIHYDFREKRYVLKHAGNFYINLKVTKEEVEALTSGLKMAGHFLPHLEKGADSLWEKLGSYIPREIVEWGAELGDSTVMATPVAPVRREVFATLLEAKHKKSAVNIRYTAPQKESRKWLLSPYEFYFRGNAWYMVSYNHKYENIGIHRISRITSASLAEQAYVPPEEGGLTEGYVSSAWHVVPGLERHFIKVHITEPLADTFREIQWHPTQKIEKSSEGGILLTAEVPHLYEVARWVLSGAPHIHVIEPEELKRQVRKFAEETLRE